MNAITVTNLTKKYGDNLAVDNISFDVKQGEFFAFLGENGAGKSTIINIICTILQKTDGEIEVLGNRLGERNDEIMASIGVVFQNSVLDEKLTVGENLSTRAACYGYTRREIKERVSMLRESFELSDVWNRRYGKLSGGQRRRTDIARALIHNPKILILDEPTTGLDPKTRRLVWDYVHRLRKTEKLTIFLTTHYMEEAADADRVVILDKGRIIADGSPASLKREYSKSRLVWYAPETPENFALLDGFSSDFTYEADHYLIPFDGSVTELLYAHRDRITDYEVIKGSMDDVFLGLTGKEFSK